MQEQGSSRSVALAASTTVAGSLSVFLVGGLSVQIREDLHFSPARLGLAVATYFGVSSASSAYMGRQAQRLGLNLSMRLAAGLSILAMLTVAAAPTWGVLVLGLGVSGIANALAQPAANGVIVRDVPIRRRGLAFGVKQSAIPVATLLGGLAVPTIALTVGWRWAFLLGALGALVVAVKAGGREVQEATRPGRPLGAQRAGPELEHVPLVMLGVSAGLAAAAAGTLGTFLTASAVDLGVAAGMAGVIQAGGSVFGITMRLSSGWFADRSSREPLFIVLMMLIGGGIGFALMGSGAVPPFVVGVGLAYGLGWAWPGLFQFAVSQRYGSSAAAATGFTQTGVYFGGVVGPLGFGFIVDHFGFGTGWAVATLFAASAAVGIQLGRRLLARRSPAESLAATGG